jgi:hypothetical protein
MSNKYPKGEPSSEVIKTFFDGADEDGRASKKLEAVMREDGWDVSASTIQRVIKNGFAPRKGKSPKTLQSTPASDAIRQVKSAAPESASPQMLAAACLEAIQNLPDGEKDRLKALVDMEDNQLEAQTLKLVKVGRYLLAEELAKHTKMMMLQPDKAAKLFATISTNIVAAAPPIAADAGAGAKLIEHNPNEPMPATPGQLAIRNFQMRMRSTAA